MCSLIKKMNGLFITVTVVFCCINGINAQNINTPNKMGPLGTEVNTFSGNLFIPRNDIYVPARDFDFNVSFYYNTYNFDTTYGFGNGWGFSYFIKYQIDSANHNTIIWGDGREDMYTPLANGNYQPPTGFFDSLAQYQPGKFLLTKLDGSKFYFDNSVIKKITKMTAPNGNYINFNYTGSLLTSIINNEGQAISFAYDGSGRLTSITDAITSPSRTWIYTYDAAGNLIKTTDPLGGTNKYAYLVNGPMKSLSDKNNNTVDIIYYGDFSVSELIGCNKRQSFSYDTTTNITIATDYLASGNNQVTTYSYTQYNNLVWLNSLKSNCCGYNMTFQYDNMGNKIRQTDANGNITSYTYDNKGNLLTQTDALNQIISFTYTNNYNNISSFTDAKGNVTSLSYDNKGNLIQLVDPGNLVYSAVYNTYGDIISSTDPRGNTFTYNYDAYGNPINVTGPDGYNATLGFDARGNLLSLTDARGNTSNLQFDILNRLKTITDPLNNGVHFTYDAGGNITSVKDQNNVTNNFNYDASNRAVQFTDAVNNKTTTSYDAMDNPTAVKNALSNATNFTYDTKNRLSSFTDALGNTSSISYDPNGNILSLGLPNGQQLSYTYDAINRVTAINDNTGTIANLSYDKNNNVTSYTNGTGATVTATYDSLDRIKHITDPLGNTYSLTYDNNSNVNTVTDRNGFAKTYTYDGLNRVKTYTDNNGFIITLGYDAQGNVISMKDQNNNTTNYVYDILNRMQTITYPGGKFIQFTYDSRGNIITKKLTDGTNINFVYDSLNRVVSKTLPGGIVYNFAYDALSRIITATNSNGTVNITYDALNRIASEIYDGRTTSYNYNIAGRTQTTVYPDSTIITKNYDTRNRLTSIVKNNITQVSYQYNNADQVIGKTFANGISTSLQYDFANRLSNISTAGGALQNSSFTYDREMNKTAINRASNPAPSEQFTYDNGYRLTNYQRGALQNTYQYDAVGNRISANLNGINTSYAVNNLNQLTNSNNASQNINFTHDNNGNLTFDGIFYKTYDGEGRLLKDSASGGNVITYLYDAIGRRVQKIINGMPYKYTYSGLAQIEERDGITNNLLNRTIFKNFITPVVNEKNGNQYFYHQNELNSVENITNSAGNLTERYQYDVYGQQTIYNSSNSVIQASLAGNRFGFTGQEYDSATKSNHFLFRNYSTTTGTFNQRDLIGYGDGTGMYQYVGDNPANGIDVVGLAKDPCAGRERSEFDKYLFDQLSHYSNYLAIINESLKGLSKDNLDLAKSKSFNAANLILQTTNLIAKIDNLRNNWNTMSTKDAQVEIAEIEFATAGIANDAGAFKAVPAFSKALGVLGAIDALDQELTGHSLSYQYAHLSDVSEKVGTVAAQRNEQRFQRLEQFIDAAYKTQGTDVSKWTTEAKAQYDIFKRVLKFRQENVIEQSKPDCPQNSNNNGTRKKTRYRYNPTGDSVEVVQSLDPNEIVGPNGQPNKHWVSVKDRLPYTILYENAKSASAPAKYVKITSPIEPKEDASTFQLSNFGFNNQTFTVPPNTASYYQRLDVRDSLGLFVDVTAGYDQIGNKAFWEFQSIDPLTLLPPADPLKGFLLLQDSSKPLNGHGFVNFSIKPKQTAITLDTIGARAVIIFDSNDSIPTNIYTNTIDAFAPTSHMNTISAITNPITLSWTGADDAGGCGINYYTIYVSTDQVNYSVLIPRISRTDTTLVLPPDSSYCFFVLATDRVGNKEILRPGEIKCTSIPPPLPVTWLYFRGKTVAKDNLLEWATASEQNSKQFDVERSLNGTSFSKISFVSAAGNSTQAKTYQYTDYNIDRLNSEYMFYRLKQVDINGGFKYSNIVKLRYSDKNTVNSIVYPNPTPGQVTILVGDIALVGTIAGIYDINGRLMESIKINASSQPVNLSKYVNGTYFIKLANNEVLKIIKQ